MIAFDRNGESGNIFFILGEALAELKVAHVKARTKDEAVEKFCDLLEKGGEQHD